MYRQLKKSKPPQLPTAPPAMLARSGNSEGQPSMWTRALDTLPLQAKLTVNQPGDMYEQQADHVAAQVMRMPEPNVQRRCACGGVVEPDGECEACKARRLGIQRKAESVGRMEAPPSVHQALHSSGQPLDTATRAFMEPRFGHDFGGVRVHTDGKAAESAKAVSAHAYTVGQNVVFADGRYAPGTDAGKQLLAHELTHVMQQTGQTHHLQRAVSCESAEQCPTRSSGETTRSRSTPMQVEIDQSASAFTVAIANFAINETAVKPDLSSNIVWSTLLSTMDTTATGQWEILGYADCQGDESLNSSLRLGRAETIAALLPPPTRARVAVVNADSLANCIASNATEAERSRNRAVLIRRLPSSTGPTPPIGPFPPVAPVPMPGVALPGVGTFCDPFPVGIIGDLEARAAREYLERVYLTFVLAQFGTEVHTLWHDYLARPKGSSLAPRIFRGAGNIIVDSFRLDPATVVELGLLETEIQGAARGIPEATVEFTGASYISPPLGLGTLLPAASLERRINYTAGHARIPGNIAGGTGTRGVGSSDAGPDLRLFTGSVRIERTRTGGTISKIAHVELQLQVIDAVDFCPGAPGGLAAQAATIPMSRLEATPRETTYDLPFHVFVDLPLHIPL
jgi:outer membrane protein OmpA-like peptidoglycan-associated protein